MAAIAGVFAFVLAAGGAELLVDGAPHAAVRIRAKTIKKSFFMGCLLKLLIEQGAFYAKRNE